MESTAKAITLAESSPKNKARLVGLLYLITILLAGVGSGIQNRLVDPRDATATATAILAHASLLRLGWAAYLVEMACNIVVTALLYDLLKPANKSVSRLAVLFALVAITIKTASRLFLIAPFFLLTGQAYLSAYTAPQLHALSQAFLNLNAQGAGLAMVFFGFYAILMGYLFIKSTFLPRVLGWLGIIAGAGWLIFLSMPAGLRYGDYVALLALVVAALKIGWFLIVGVNEQRWREQAQLASTSIWA